jgi:molybdopterin synthase catalytic subunit
MLPPKSGRDWIALTHDPLPLDAAAAWATTPASGAVVSFAGVVRDHAEGRDGVRAMTYEAYEEPARARLAELAAALRDRWPVVERVALLHRLGDLMLSEASVLVVVSAPHRDAAFEAARFAIDELKQTAPIWKKEHWADGDGWALGATAIRSLDPSRRGATEERLDCASGASVQEPLGARAQRAGG